MTEKKIISSSEEYFVPKKLDKSVQKRKNGGPDNKSEREKRRERVWGLHFDHGWNVTRIAEKLGKNRHTIESDLQCFYSTLDEQLKDTKTELVTKYWHRLETQQQRIFGLLSYCSETQYFPAERLYFQINSKMIDVLLDIKSESN